MSDYTPRPEHKFSFGLWTVSNRGRDPFGEASDAEGRGVVARSKGKIVNHGELSPPWLTVRSYFLAKTRTSTTPSATANAEGRTGAPG